MNNTNKIEALIALCKAERAISNEIDNMSANLSVDELLLAGLKYKAMIKARYVHPDWTLGEIRDYIDNEIVQNLCRYTRFELKFGKPHLKD